MESSVKMSGGDFDFALLEGLPSDKAEQAKNQITNQQLVIDDLKKQCENLKINSDQRFFELEQQLLSSTNESKEAKETLQSIRKQYNDIESKYTETSQMHRSLQEDLFTKCRAWTSEESDLREKLSQAEAVGRELSYNKDCLMKEIQDLKDNLESKTSEVKELLQARLAAEMEAEKSKADSRKAEEQAVSVQSERDRESQRLDWLENQLRETTEKYFDQRKQVANSRLEMESSLEQKTLEIEHLKASVKRLESTNVALQEMVDESSQKLQESQDFYSSAEKDFHLEIQGNKKLIKLHKDFCDNKTQENKELQSAVAELRQMLKATKEGYDQLKECRKNDLEKFQEEIHQRDEMLSKQETEIEMANQLVEELKGAKRFSVSDDSIQLSPSVKAASKLLKPGMTLTQIYSEYVTMSEQLSVEKEKNEGLNLHLQHFCQQVEEKAPLLQKQKEEYVQAVDKVNQMARQLDTAMLESERMRLSAEENNRRCAELRRENKRLQQQGHDLGQQVRMLLRELEESRGRVVRMDDEMVASSDTANTSQVISDNLITFRSIEELQQQNERLVQVVRDLGEKCEADENTATREKTAELKQQLEKALGELEELRGSRQREAEMVESIVRQRDMYRVLYTQSGASPLPSNIPTSTPASALGASPILPRSKKTPLPSPQTPNIPASRFSQEDAKILEDTKAALSQLKEEFSSYRKEKSENESMSSEQLEKFRNEASEMKLKNAKLSSQASFMSDRFKILQSNVEGYKREISNLREKNQKYSNVIVKHEQTINMLKEDFLETKEKLTRLEVNNQSLLSQCDLMRTAESRLTMEKEVTRSELQSMQMLMSNLRAINANLEKTSADMRESMERKMENLEAENKKLTQRLMGTDPPTLQRISRLEKDLSDAYADLKKERTSAKIQERQLELLTQNAADLKAQNQELQDQMTAQRHDANRSVLHSGSSVESSTEPNSALVLELKSKKRDLQEQLDQSQLEIKALTDQLVQAKQHVQQFKAIADSVEKTLNEQNEASKIFKEATEAQIQEANAAKEESEERNAALLKEIAELKAVPVVVETTPVAVLESKVKALESEIEELRVLKEAAESTERTARLDLQQQATLAQESQEKFEREMILHAADLQNLNQLKEEVESFQAKMADMEGQMTAAKTELQASKEAWEEQRKMYADNEERMSVQTEQLKEQADLLLQEIEHMSSKLMEAENSQAKEKSTGEQLLARMQSEEEVLGPEKSSANFIQIIRTLTKEKELVEANERVLKAEANRLKAHNQHLKKEVESTQEKLQKELNETEVARKQAASYERLSKEVHDINILRDSNVLLRTEKDGLQAKLSQATTKVKSLEADMTPLRGELREQKVHIEALMAEKVSLEKEVKNWKTRTDHLIEECNRIDKEELEKAKQARIQLQTQLNAKNEEAKKLNAQVTKVTEELNAARNEMGAAKMAHELTKSDADEKNKANLQLKKIARKYKVQAEEKDKEIEALKSKSTEHEGAQATICALQEEKQKSVLRLKTLEDNVKQMQEKLKAAEEQLQATDAKAKAANEQLTSAQLKLTSAEAERNATTNEIKEKSSLVSALEAEVNKLKSESEGQKGSEATPDVVQKLTSEKEELEKKNASFKNILQQAKAKVLSLSEENRKLQANTQSASQSAESLKAEFEARINALENVLKETRAAQSSKDELFEHEMEALKKENAELQQRHQALQRQYESTQKQPSTGAAAKPTVSASPVERAGPSSAEAPRTANIKPMATPASAQSRLPQSSVPPMRSMAEARAMASIRPMAVAQTPTATVMPSVQESEVLPIPRPMQQVQPVSPHVEDSVEEVGDSTEEPSGSSSETPPQPSTSHKRPREEGPHLQVEPEAGTSTPAKRTKVIQETSSQSSTDPVEVEQTEQKTSKVAVTRPLASEESADVEDVEQLEEVGDEDGEDEGEEADMEEEEEEEEDEDDCVVVVEDDDSEQGNPTYDEEEDEEEEDDEVEEYEGEEREEDEEEEEGDDDIVIVESDDSEAEMVAQKEEEEEEEEEEDGDEEDDEDGVAEEEEGEEEEDMAEEAEGSEESPEGSTVPPEVPSSVASSEQSQAPGTLARMASQPAQVPSGRGPLTPFAFGADGGFELGDDGIVPSTPTLLVPRRNDGFAEAVSSPGVQQRFLFSGSEQQPADVAQLAVQGGVDDTRMDLSQFDDSQQHSVPPAAPVINILRASPPSTEQVEEEVIEEVEEEEDAGEEAAATEEAESQEADLAEAAEDSGNDVSVASDGDSQSSLPQQPSDPSEERSSTDAKPKKIQRITWSSPQPAASSSPSLSRPQPVRRFRGRGNTAIRGSPMTRGTTQVRGRGVHSRGSLRGPARGNRGGARGGF